jgi:hypothetical protein
MGNPTLRETIMRASRRIIQDGSFRERVEDLVPLIGTDASPTAKSLVKPLKAAAGLRGTVAHQLNQYLFERSTRSAALSLAAAVSRSSSGC